MQYSVIYELPKDHLSLRRGTAEVRMRTAFGVNSANPSSFWLYFIIFIKYTVFNIKRKL